MRRKALILGVTGQDGSLLAKNLLDEGYEVYGGMRRGSSGKLWRLHYLGIEGKVTLINFQLTDLTSLIGALSEIQPDEVYALAAESYVADSFGHWTATFSVNAIGAINVLEALRIASPAAKIFMASSSEIFDHDGAGGVANESWRMRPSNPYGLSKLCAFHSVRLARDTHGANASSGILFNHEGPVRGRQFITRKITFNLARLRVAGGEPFALGALDATRDWGAAEDYVKAIRLILTLDKPDDYIVATGQLTSVRTFLKLACSAAGFRPEFEGAGINEICVDQSSGRVLARVAKKYFRPFDTAGLAGDSTKVREMTGWNGSRSVEQLAAEMVEADINRFKSGQIND